jgi:hypothetical protein
MSGKKISTQDSYISVEEAKLAYQDKKVNFADKLSFEVSYGSFVHEKYYLLYVLRLLEQVHPTPGLVNRRVYPYWKSDYNDRALERSKAN